MAKVIGPRELELKAMTEQRSKSAKAPKVGASRPVKAWRDMTDAERAEYMKDPQGIQARAAADAAETTTAEAEASEPPTPPTKASAKQEKATMAKKAKAKKKSTTKAKASKASVKKSAPISDGDNKTAIILEMLQSAKGCTAAEVCARTGWAAVSISPIAKRAKLKLRKEPEGRGVRYFATAA